MAPLPFDRLATITAQGGADPIAGVPCSPAWPLGSRANRTGVQHDHTAQVPIARRADVEGTNRKITIDGTTYSIIDAAPAEFLPHVELQLRRVAGG